jgi:hypothetical protein
VNTAGVAVCRADQQQDAGLRGDGRAVQFDVLRGAARDGLAGRVEPQRLGDPVIDAAVGEHLGPLVGGLCAGEPRVAQQQHRGLDAGTDQQDQDPDDLLGGQPVGALGRVEQRRHQVVAALAAARHDQLGVVADQRPDRLQRFRRQVGGLLVVPVHDRHAEVADHVPVRLGDPDQFGDHLGREPAREVGHHVERSGVQQRLQVPPRDLAQARLQRHDAPLGERVRHQRPHPGVLRRVHRDEGEEALGVRSPEGRLDAQAVDAGEAPGVTQRRVDVGVAGDRPEVVAVVAEDRVVLAQLRVDRVRVVLNGRVERAVDQGHAGMLPPRAEGTTG